MSGVVFFKVISIEYMDLKYQHENSKDKLKNGINIDITLVESILCDNLYWKNNAFGAKLWY